MVIVVDMDCIDAPDPFSYPFPLPPLTPEDSATRNTSEPLWNVHIEKPLFNISESLLDLD